MKLIINYLKKNILILMLILSVVVPGKIFCQPAKNGTLEFLSKINGFKEIRLGADARLIPGDKLAYLDGNDKPDADSCFMFEYLDNGIKDTGDGVSLDLVGIRTFKHKIVNIYLFFKREDGVRIYKQFLADYGTYTAKDGDFMYDWITDGVNLSLRYEVAVDLGVAIFTCNGLEKKLGEKRSGMKFAAEKIPLAFSVF